MQRFEYSPRDESGSVDPHDAETRKVHRDLLRQRESLDSSGRLQGDDAKAEKTHRAFTAGSIFADQRERDADMEIARRLATGQAHDAKHSDDYQQYLRQLKIEDGR